MNHIWTLIAIVLGLAFTSTLLATEAPSPYQLDVIPANYHLQSFDDCGVPDRQPHVHARDIYTFPADQVQADEKARTVAWGDQHVDIDYEHLDAQSPYIIAITYANEKFNNRVQSLWADTTQLQGPHALPKGKSERLIFRIPAEAIRGGALHLQCRLEAQVNAVVSAVELWSTAPSPNVLHLSDVSGLMTDLQGKVLNIAYDPDPGATVRLMNGDASTPLATAQTGADGSFDFPRSLIEKIDRTAVLHLVASRENVSTEQMINASDLFFDPIRYRPLPAAVDGLEHPQLSLNGTWKINREASEASRNKPLTDNSWQPITVPGQWVEQGFNIAEDKPALMADEFTIPTEWKGRRIILRFDAIHAGTQYWLNGKLLGSSENLFTPVEWDITDAARIGQTNRLDLQMLVQTASERLSSSSSYTGHSLGGIDRSVKIFALPHVHINTLHLNAGLDEKYLNGDLQLDLGIANLESSPHSDLSIVLQILDAVGKPIHHSAESPTKLGALNPGPTQIHLASTVPNPLKWNAEQPNLYKLVIELHDGATVLERIERNIGFRKIEWKDRQLWVNGVRVKLAGVAHHEVDPLTGRAATAKHAEEDIRLLKSANLNYLRTSHYPPTDELLDAADRLGMYVECEAPFCWATASDPRDLKIVLIPSSARIDFCHTHPSIIVWSLANESNWGRVFDIDNRLTKSLDPSRPTTFNHPFANANLENCDICNRHYLPMPYEDAVKGDPRPFIHGECFFEIYHQRTDVGVDPGLRTLWSAGSADPNSDIAKVCLESWKYPGMVPGIYPGAWSYIANSHRFIGTVIWSGVDDIMFTRDGTKYSSENGNAYWGLIDGWRRPKPELWLAKLVFTPAWIPTRQFDWDGHAPKITVPIENRYSFTNLSALKFTWEFGGSSGALHVDVPPAQKGSFDLPIPNTTKPGDAIKVTATNSAGELVNTVLIHLGQKTVDPLPVPSAGAPAIKDNDKTATISGDHFCLVFEKAHGDFDSADSAHHSAVLHFPRLHLTQFDFGDLESGRPPYAVMPDEETRLIEQVQIVPTNSAAEISVKDHYTNFAGRMNWIIDRKGIGQISYDYVYTGPDLYIRELGIRLALKRDCDTLNWNRWSEWDIYPDDHIARCVGTARATRDPQSGPANAPESMRPTWSWAQDQTDLGTNDFRSIKFNIYNASLLSQAGGGIDVHAQADAHVRACLAPEAVLLHILSRCTLTPTTIKAGDHLTGHYSVSLETK